MVVSQIAAMSFNRVIGVNNQLPWDIPEDLKFFKDKTKNKIVIMGRKTFESLNSKPLPYRFNIVITRNKNLKVAGVTVVDSIVSALKIAETKINEWGEEIFVIGGAEIYKLALPYTDRIYLTEIQKEFKGDVKFPEFDKKIFKMTEKSDRTEPIPFSFITYDRVVT